MISVIMPIHNTEQYLDDAVSSIVSQTYPDWELIAIDDGSTDGSGKIIDEWASRDSRIRVLHTENEGVAAARNLGLKEMSGEYIQFIDSDDKLVPTALEETVSIMENSDTDMVIFDAFYEGVGVNYHNKAPLPIGTYEPQTVLAELAKPSLSSCIWDKPCRSILYKDIVFPEGELYEDVAVVFYPISQARKIAVIGKPLYLYRQRRDSITNSVTSDNTVHKWRYIQYRKRYEYLKDNYEDIAYIAKNSLIRTALLHYAFNGNVLQPDEKKSLYKYICSPEFETGITNRKVFWAKRAFKLMPRTTGYLLRKMFKPKSI